MGFSVVQQDTELSDITSISTLADLPKNELDRLQVYLLDIARIQDSTLITEISDYIFSAGGKRIRPLLLIMLAKMMNCTCEKTVYKLAAALEFIHTATLLHDDIIDESTLRRNKPAAHLNWGVRNSITTGDWLFATSFELITSLTNSDKIMPIIVDMTKRIAMGELEQLDNKNCTQRFLSDLSIEDYFEVIKAKTAILFAASSELAACISNQSEVNRRHAKQFGMHLGIAFQLQDDILDYIGDPKKIGKNLGDDLAEGKVTLPVIYLNQDNPAFYKAIIHKIINKKLNNSDFSELVCYLREKGIIDKCKNQVIEQQNKALFYLNQLINSDSDTEQQSQVYYKYLYDLTVNLSNRIN